MRARLIVLGATAGALAIGACLVDIPDVESGCDACAAAPGFVPVLFALDRAASCPPGTLSSDVVADPGDAGPGACACSCSVSTQPSCYPANVPTAFDLTTTPTCNQTGLTLQIADAGCVQKSGTLGGGHVSLSPSPPVGGACSVVAEPDAAAVPSALGRVCAAGSCAGAACVASAGFRACFSQAGDVACPSGLEKHVVGSAVTVGCACAPCAMVIDGGCEGTVTLYANADCTSAIEAPIPVNGTCEGNTVDAGTAFKSAAWSPSLVGIGCSAGEASVTGVDLAARATICCPP